MFVNDRGEPDGFAVDLYTRMMGDLEIPYEFRVEKINILYKGLLDGEIDLFTGMLYTKENENVFYFPHTSFKTSWGELFVGADVLYSDIYDLEGQTIGMVKDDLNGKNFIKFMEQFSINYQTREYPAFNDLFNAVRNGEIFGGITNSQYQQRREEGGIKPTATTFYPSSTYAVTGLEQGNIEALEKLSRYLSELKSDPDSYYYELEQKWYNPRLNRLNPQMMRIIIISLLTLAAIIVFLFFNNRFLKNEVDRQVKLMKRQEVEKERVELKNDFLTTISHELRTPMNVISSLIFLLSQSSLDGNQRDKINKVNKASHLILNIINNFLDFNRLEKGHINLERIPFSPKGEISDVIAFFADDIREKGLYLESHLDNNIPEVLWGDPYRFTQILTNLTGNAIKFSKRGTISLGVFVEQLSRNNCRLNITVKDEGIGIDEDKMEKLFLPFTQADDSISRQFGGSGLGLAICYQLVHLMGGTISVTSQKGKGSAFTLSVPFDIARKEDCKEEQLKDVLDSYQGAKVLYVEDNPINREIGLELLKMAQLDVRTAENGIDALESMVSHDFDLVLMDIQMPFMDGFTAVRKIRERETSHGLPRTPVVALTAHFLKEDINRAYEAGMDGHISKPISIAQLNREFSKWLSSFRIKEEKRVNSAAPERLSLPGVDWDGVMDRFDGNVELLLESLSQFISDYELMPGFYLTLGSQHKNEELMREIHTVKGVLGTLGLMDLTKKAESLEMLLREERDYSRDLRQFSLDLEDTLSDLKGTL